MANGIGEAFRHQGDSWAGSDGAGRRAARDQCHRIALHFQFGMQHHTVKMTRNSVVKQSHLA